MRYLYVGCFLLGIKTNSWDFKKYFIYLFIFREGGREGEREGEKHQCVVASHVAPTGDLVCNPGMCPDWNQTSDPLVRRLYAIH